ncbi:MAG: class I SAM-dependent RNA methyltransferase [Clostridiales bacterium]|nr:class I SAM-dependent RNA methyltransferase [Clostridiales bacterium]
MKKGQIYEGTAEKIKFPNRGIVSGCHFVAANRDELQNSVGKSDTDKGTQTEGEIVDGRTGVCAGESRNADECGAVIVKNVIPGQRVLFAIRKKRGGRAEGQLLEVLEKSPLEKESPDCPHFGVCGGCNYQTLPYAEQLKLKSAQVLELMREVVPNAADIFEGIKASPRQFGYRNKMEFTFGDETKDGPLTLGMHKRGGMYDIVSVDQCRIVDEDYRRILSATESYFREKQTPFYHRMRHEGYLRHLLVRKAVKTGEILIDLVTTTQNVSEKFHIQESMPQEKKASLQAENKVRTERELLSGWMQALLALNLEGAVTGILHTKNDSPADAVKDEGTEILYGKDYFYEEILGLKFRITPFSFFQTNSLGAEVLYETARGFIRESMEADGQSLKGKTVFDLYSGTGTIAQMLASVSGRVVGVEIVEEAVEAAKRNAVENGLTNCEFIAGDVLKALDEVEEKPDFIVLDPPREGVHPKALKKIIGYGVEKMIYISCKPTSLQRDLAVLQKSGYRVERMCCIDLFPGTVHCETIVLLSNRKIKPDSHVRLSLDMEDYYRFADQRK